MEQQQNDIRDFFFLVDLIHSGEYNIRITWGDVFPVLAEIQTGDVRECCARALNQGYTNGCAEDDPFMLLRPYGGEAKGRPELLERLLEVVQEDPFTLNVATLLYLQQSLVMGILGSFYDHAIDFVDSPRQRVLLSMITAPGFLEHDTVTGFLEQRLADIDDDLGPLHRHLRQGWFLELLLIIKNGYYGNGNFNYIDTLESSFRESFIAGILDLIRSGELVKLLVRLQEFLGDQQVRERIRRFVSKTETAEHLRRLYDWLSIGNDLAIGLEFLVGSICFLPGHNQDLGVWLFILGSSQLLIRPIIAIIRKTHLGRLYRRKIKF